MKKLLLFGLLLVSGASMYAMETEGYNTNHPGKPEERLTSKDRLLGQILKYEGLTQQLLQMPLSFANISREDNEHMMTTHNAANKVYKNTFASDESIEKQITALKEVCLDLEGICQECPPQKLNSPSFLSKTQKRVLIGGVGIGVVVVIMGSSYGIYRYVKNAHAKGEKTVFDRLFAKVGLKKKCALSIA